ncbi:hypothetical protein [Nocardia heshunensis]
MTALLPGLRSSASGQRDTDPKPGPKEIEKRWCRTAARSELNAWRSSRRLVPGGEIKAWGHPEASSRSAAKWVIPHYRRESLEKYGSELFGGFRAESPMRMPQRGGSAQAAA